MSLARLQGTVTRTIRYQYCPIPVREARCAAAVEARETPLSVTPFQLCGGPPCYAEQSEGAVCVTDARRPFSNDERVRDQWLTCMRRAREQGWAQQRTARTGGVLPGWRLPCS